MNTNEIIYINAISFDLSSNWLIQRFDKDNESYNPKIIGLNFPFEDFLGFEDISQFFDNLEQDFNTFSNSDFFKKINYIPQHRDVFKLKLYKIASFYWIEFVFTKGKFVLKKKRYGWENQLKIMHSGYENSESFIVSKINYKVESEKCNNQMNALLMKKEDLPINKNYIFYYSKSDGLRTDFRLLSFYLYVNKKFDYSLEIKSNKFSKKTGREVEVLVNGQLPLKILLLYLDIIKNENFSDSYGRRFLDVGRNFFWFQINNKIIETSIGFIEDENKDSQLHKLVFFEKKILKWLHKIYEFHLNN